MDTGSKYTGLNTGDHTEENVVNNSTYMGLNTEDPPEETDANNTEEETVKKWKKCKPLKKTILRKSKRKSAKLARRKNRG